MSANTDYYIDQLTKPGTKAFENVSRNAIMAGHGAKTAELVHQAAMEYSAKMNRPYLEIELLILNHMEADPGSRVNLNAKLDKFSQPLKPGPNLDQTAKNAGIIMKAQHRSKSSKGKHPKNYTPPKKKRK
jgi:hypothetical protein